jgi:hypothetical protein
MSSISGEWAGEKLGSLLTEPAESGWEAGVSALGEGVEAWTLPVLEVKLFWAAVADFSLSVNGVPRKADGREREVLRRNSLISAKALDVIESRLELPNEGVEYFFGSLASLSSFFKKSSASGT